MRALPTLALSSPFEWQRCTCQQADHFHQYLRIHVHTSSFVAASIELCDLSLPFAVSSAPSVS